MATIDKTKLHTYNFLSENKSIEDIKNQPNIEVKEKRRHGGKTFKLVEKNDDNIQKDINDLLENNRENLESVISNLTNDEKDQEIKNDIWIKLKNLFITSTSNTEKIAKLQSIIEEKDKEIEQLKKQIEELKQSNKSELNLKKYTYNAITIYDEKQRQKTGIKKIHEEILPIEDKVFFITTLLHDNQSITEEIMHFHQFKNGNIKVFKQNKHYLNINEYKNNTYLIDEQNQNLNKITVKDFLKQHNDLKIKPTKIEKRIWWTITIISLSLIILTPVLTFALPTIPAITTAVGTIAIVDKILISTIAVGIGTIFKGATSIFSTATKKVELWWYNKLCKNQEKKEKDKNELEKIIKNLTSDKLETKLETQFKILKQELDNKKHMMPNKLISDNKINHNSNSILENSIIKFDSSLKNSINHQEQQPSTSSINNWNKVKVLLTT